MPGSNTNSLSGTWRPARITKLPGEAAHVLNQAILEINGRIDNLTGQIRPHLKSSSTLNFGTIPAQQSVERTVNIQGANTSGVAHASPSNGVTLGNPHVVWSAYVSAMNQVKVRLMNPTASPVAINTILWNVYVQL